MRVVLARDPVRDPGLSVSGLEYVGCHVISQVFMDVLLSEPFTVSHSGVSDLQPDSGPHTQRQGVLLFPGPVVYASWTPHSCPEQTPTPSSPSHSRTPLTSSLVLPKTPEAAPPPRHGTSSTVPDQRLLPLVPSPSLGRPPTTGHTSLSDAGPSPPVPLLSSPA